jgi:predicted kinase
VAVLICFSGLPAVGKSTVAQVPSAQTGAIWLRLDAILRREYEPFETAHLRLDICGLSPEAAVQAMLEFLAKL